jgi:hypothetical protein
LKRIEHLLERLLLVDFDEIVGEELIKLIQSDSTVITFVDFLDIVFEVFQLLNRTISD